jgi:hypothetical protein
MKPASDCRLDEVSLGEVMLAFAHTRLKELYGG